jgi:hypothetical protein
MNELVEMALHPSAYIEKEIVSPSDNTQEAENIGK